MSDPLNHLGSIWLENVSEINKCGGWNFSKLVSVGSTFIREMRVNHQTLGAHVFLVPTALYCIITKSYLVQLNCHK